MLRKCQTSLPAFVVKACVGEQTAWSCPHNVGGRAKRRGYFLAHSHLQFSPLGLLEKLFLCVMDYFLFSEFAVMVFISHLCKGYSPLLLRLMKNRAMWGSDLTRMKREGTKASTRGRFITASLRRETLSGCLETLSLTTNGTK